MNKFKVLCVDDELDILDILTTNLSALGFETLRAANIADAMTILSVDHARTVLVISDFKFEQGTGFDLRAKMMEKHANIPFVICSGFISREAALEAINLKVSNFIEKPIDLKSLSELVKKESEVRISAIKEEDELLAGFTVDAENLIEEIEGHLLALESNPGEIDLINRVFACAHTIKGTSGFFRPDYVHRFTHKYEDYISKLKKNIELVSSDTISALLSGLDIIKRLVAALKVRSDEVFDIEELSQIFVDAGKPPGPQQKDDAKSDTKKAGVEAVENKGTELRVSVTVLDEFMERSGELTVLRNMINKVVRVIEKENPANKNIATLTELLGEMHKTNGLMQDKVTDLRKLPLKQVFRPLNRTIRDLGSSLKKKIDLKFSGDDIRVDHSLADVLSKCLIHMVRNSADHGIETEERRKQLGKSETGTILLEAEEVGDDIIVRVKDDGRGVNPNIVKEKALQKGLKTKAELDKMSVPEIQMLIFEPGFSTAQQVTDISGRGVGTDMVLKCVTGIGGNIKIVSEVDKGTEFHLRLPTPKSVLIISSLMVRCGNEIYGIAQDAIDRIIHVNEEEFHTKIKKINGASYVESDWGLLPCVHLNSILTGENIGNPKGVKAHTCSLVVAWSKLGHFCIEVDDILDIEDTVVKSTRATSVEDSILSGATFLGDGNVGLLLGVDGIAKRLNMKVKKQANHEQDKSSNSKVKSQTEDFMLLVESDLPGYFGIHQNQIYRLEEFSPSNIQFSGRLPMVLYRDQPMPLLSLMNLIEKNSKDLDLTLVTSTLVVRLKNHFYGICVKKIIDLVKLEDGDLSNRLDRKNGDLPRVIVGERTVALLNILERLEVLVGSEIGDSTGFLSA